MKKVTAIAWTILAVLVVGFGLVADAAPYPEERPLYLDQYEKDRERLYEMMSNLDRFIQLQDNEKRGFGLDFGLNRGFSGAQAAKHLMGMAAANYAGGPGRRRRSDRA